MVIMVGTDVTDDKELAEINNKKLKAKGAKIVEKEQKVNYEAIVVSLSQFLNARGLELMNVSQELRDVVANERQKAHTKQNFPDSEKQ